jgi:hypothetical protein
LSKSGLNLVCNINIATSISYQQKMIGVSNIKNIVKLALPFAKDAIDKQCRK